MSHREAIEIFFWEYGGRCSGGHKTWPLYQVFRPIRLAQVAALNSILKSAFFFVWWTFTLSWRESAELLCMRIKYTRNARRKFYVFIGGIFAFSLTCMPRGAVLHFLPCKTQAYKTTLKRSYRSTKGLPQRQACQQLFKPGDMTSRRYRNDYASCCSNLS